MDFSSEADHLGEALGSFHRSTSLRAVYVPYTDADIAALTRQVKTGRSPYEPKVYQKANTWREKKRLLALHTAPYHEAFHYFQALATSYGILAQLVAVCRNSWFLSILLEHQGLPGESLTQYIMKHRREFKNSPLSPEFILCWAAIQGTISVPVSKRKTKWEGKFFQIQEARIGKDMMLPLVSIRLGDRLVPFGAEVLLESWAHSAMRALVSLTFGNDAAKDYSTRMGIGLYPYKVTDLIMEQIGLSSSALENPVFMSAMAALVAYYGLNCGLADLSNPSAAEVKPESVPGYRAAYLAGMLSHRLEKTGSKDMTILFDACDLTFVLDKTMEWFPFLLNSYRAFDRTEAHMSRITQGDWRHAESLNLAPFARFLGSAENTILRTVLDTGVIFDVREWHRDYMYSDLPRPPISLFMQEVEGKPRATFVTMSNKTEEVAVWTNWYIASSIIEQKIRHPTFECPLAFAGRRACPEYEDHTCTTRLASFHLPRAMAKKRCLLAHRIEDLRDLKRIRLS